ncbi:MAG: glycerol-3-phosphate dehydrogenase [Pseudomonadota bacterium]
MPAMTASAAHPAETSDPIFDVFVIGGGINGCGIARDLVGRGYTVALAEKNDFASGTSSWSTKLIHGGLRYLEHYEFRLVREALLEREVLWSMAPHIIRPLRFVLPHHKGLRPRWLLRTGLFLYDNLGGRKALPGTSTVDLAKGPLGAPLKDAFAVGFEYSDCWVDDARLVVLNARDAADRGATIMPHTEVVSVRPDGGHWAVTVRGEGETTHLARCVVNAAGPWVDRVLGQSFGRNDAHNVRLVQGSHIVIRQKFAHDRAYIFQNADKRIIFAIPYEDDFTLIGTTDRDYEGDPREAKISPEETAYLCAAASEYFAEPVREEDIVWTYSGVRPLYDDGASAAQEATRDYVLKTAGGGGEPALLNVFGGKLTTYRKLAEAAVEKIGALIGVTGKPWTAGAPLPGGHMPLEHAARYGDDLRKTYPFLSEKLAKRLARLYGVRAQSILDGCASMDDLGRHFGADLHEREVIYLMDEEWARRAEDVLWRRSKLGLRVGQDEAAALDAFMTQRRAQTAAAAAE